MKKIASSVGLIVGGLLAALPFSALAATDAGGVGQNIIGQATGIAQSAGTLANQLTLTLNLVIGVLIALSIVVFIWSIIRYILLAKSDDDKNSAKKQMLWSIVAIAVIVGIFGIANLLLATFGVNNNRLNNNQIPVVPVNVYQ